MTADGPDEDRAADADDADEAAVSDDDRAYGAHLGDVLRRRNVPDLRAFLEAQAGRYGDERQVEAIRAQSDAEIETLLHRMTLARPDLRRLHAESARWLAERGLPGADRGGSSGGGRRRSRGRRPPGG